MVTIHVQNSIALMLFSLILKVTADSGLRMVQSYGATW